MSIGFDVNWSGRPRSRIQVLSAQGLGVWRSADQKVKVYKYLKQVTNCRPPRLRGAIVAVSVERQTKGRLYRRDDGDAAVAVRPSTPPELQPAPPRRPPHEAKAPQPRTRVVA